MDDIETVYDSDKDNEGSNDWMEEGAEYSPKSEFSKPKVTEEAVNRCNTLRAKEMKKGYYNTTISKDGLPLRTWVEDSRKAYCSAVQALKNLLMPEILGDTNFDKGKTKRIGQLYKKYAYHILEPRMIEGNVKYFKTEKFYMPEIDSVVQIRNIYPNGTEKLIPIAGHWNVQVNAYWDHMVKLHDELFAELVSVVHRLNYFKQQIRFG